MIKLSPNSVVIITALRIEYLAVRSHLTNLQETIHPNGTIYEQGQFDANNQTWTIGIVEVEAGNVSAAVEAERAIAYFNPSFVFLVGIASGIKDVKIGDVVAATKVYGYESGKVGEQFYPRPKLEKSNYALEQRARVEARRGDWLKRVVDNPRHSSQILVSPIASGDKIVASRQSKIFQFLRSNYNDAIAVEMEGFGFLQAAFTYPNIQSIVILGISDLIYDKNDDYHDSESGMCHQEQAAKHASAFAFELLAKQQISNVPPSTGELTLLEQYRKDVVSLLKQKSAIEDEPPQELLDKYSIQNFLRIPHDEMNIDPAFNFVQMKGEWTFIFTSFQQINSRELVDCSVHCFRYCLRNLWPQKINSEEKHSKADYTPGIKVPANICFTVILVNKISDTFKDFVKTHNSLRFQPQNHGDKDLIFFDYNIPVVYVGQENKLYYFSSPNWIDFLNGEAFWKCVRPIIKDYLMP